MITVEFAPSLRRHVECPLQTLSASDLGMALRTALLAAPQLASYVFDDQGAIRKHVAVFVNNTLLHDRSNLAYPLRGDDKVLVIQALTGG